MEAIWGYTERLGIKNVLKNKDISRQNKLKEFMATKPALQKILRRILHTEEERNVSIMRAQERINVMKELCE